MSIVTSNLATNGAMRVPQTETKHGKFLRLAQARTIRALDDIRLISQLSARTYEHKSSEAEIIVKTLSDAVGDVAKTFSVPFASKVGKADKADLGSSIFKEAKPKTIEETSKVQLTVAKALELMKQGESDAAQVLLSKIQSQLSSR